MIGDPQLDTDSFAQDDEGLKRQGLPAIGRVNPSGLPPLVLRGVQPQPQKIEPDKDLTSRKAADESELNRLQTTGSGIAQIGRKNKIAGGILRGLDVAGSILAPGVMANIPGTELHHNLLLKRQRGLLGEDVAEQEKSAQAAESQARAQAATTPKEEWELVPGWTGPNGEPMEREKNSGQFRVATVPEGSKPAGQKISDAFQLWQQSNPNGTFADWQKATAEGKTPKSTKEQLQAQIVEAENKGDAALAKKLQQQLKDIDPEGQQRITVQAGNQNTGRSDKSYQLQSTRLDKMRQPVDQLIQRMGRLVETLNQQSPQADALIAPELLTVMAGGQGSGLRMNEAEIARIVGGRSVWEGLKAAAQQWKTDPESARSITPDQDRQIRSLIQAVHEKLAHKQTVLDKAEEDLLASDDPKEHRRIVAGARKDLDAVDSVPVNQSAGGGRPDGATMKVPGSDGKLHWSDGKKDLGVVEE